ncbi:MAG: hypothetical protein IPL38_04045 [Rhodobacter sp.]|nr:hypothetical protein [Rhodobacter sp.]
MTTESCSIDGARATIYRDGPDWDGVSTATIGAFSCETAQAGARLLTTICARLAGEGIAAVIGPMNGDTWHSYRLVLDTDGSKPFLMEPQSSPDDLAAFEAAGFAPISRYFSARARVEDAIGPEPGGLDGIEIATWDGTAPEAHFAEVHALSTRAFAANAFYRPIGPEAFLGLYMPFVPLLKPELIFTARDRATGDLVGYLFGIPNYGPGPAPDTVILKTYASLHPGLGHHLSHAFHSQVARMGFATVIHALIHDDNRSADRSRRHGGQVFRRYVLMGRRLDD